MTTWSQLTGNWSGLAETWSEIGGQAMPSTTFNFETDTTGAVPAGMTVRNGTAFSVASAVIWTGSDGKFLRLLAPTGDQERFISFDNLDGQSNVDITCLMSFSAGTDGWQNQIFFRSEADPENNSYLVGYETSGNGSVYLDRYLNGSWSRVETASATLPQVGPDSWWHLRGRADGDTFYAKAWLLGAPEPQEWNLEFTDTNGPSGQYNGIGAWWGEKSYAFDNITIELIDILPGTGSASLNVYHNQSVSLLTSFREPSGFTYLPPTLTLENLSATTNSLSWTDEGATKYIIERNSFDGSQWNLDKIIELTALSLLDDVEEGWTYRYRIRSVLMLSGWEQPPKDASASLVVNHDHSASLTFSFVANEPEGLVFQSATADGGTAPYEASNAVDGNSSTRWSHDAVPSNLVMDLGEVTDIGGVRIHQYEGNNGNPATFNLFISTDGVSFTPVYAGESTGALDGFETYRWHLTPARYVRYTGYGRSDTDWNSIVDVEPLLYEQVDRRPITPPLNASAGDGQVVLTATIGRPGPWPTEWTFYGGNSSGALSELSSGTSLTLTDTNLEPGTERFYKVRAANVFGWRESSIVSATPTGVVPDPDPDPGTITHGTQLTTSMVGYVGGGATLGQMTTGGTVSSTGPNTTIQLRDCTRINVNHNNVTVRNCRVRHGSGANGIVIASGVTGTTVEFCYLDGLGQVQGNFGSIGVTGGGAGGAGSLIRRNHFRRGRIGASGLRGPNTVVEENYVESLTIANGSHGNGFSYHGHGNGGFHFRRNRTITSNSGGITFYASSGRIDGCDIVDNYIIGSGQGFGIYGGYTHTYYQDNRDVRINNNRFSGTFGFPGSVSEGTATAVDLSRPGNTFSTNRWVGSSSNITPEQVYR